MCVYRVSSTSNVPLSAVASGQCSVDVTQLNQEIPVELPCHKHFGTSADCGHDTSIRRSKSN